MFLVLQIILALGNYMNSSKRGAVYGFKLQSLDLVKKKKKETESSGVLNPATIFLHHLFVPVFPAAWHQVHRPKANTVALHCQRGEGEIHAGFALLQWTALCGESRSRWVPETSVHRNSTEHVCDPSIFFPLTITHLLSSEVWCSERRCSSWTHKSPCVPSLAGERPPGREGAAERNGADQERVQHARPQHHAQGLHRAQREQTEEAAGRC